MTTSTPPTWQWLDECYVPVTLSTDSRILPVAATISAQSDNPDPTYQDCRPSERYPSDGPDGEPEMSSSTTRKLDPDPTGEDVWPLERAVSQTGNAPGAGNIACDGAAQNYNEHINAAPSHRIGTCYLDPDTGETVMPADFFGEKELRWPAAQQWHGHDGEVPVTVANPFLHEMMDKAEGGAADKLRGVHVAKCPVCLHELESDEGILCDKCEEPVGTTNFAVVNGASGVFVYHIYCYDDLYQDGDSKTLDTLDPTLDTEADTVPLWKQAFWLARHIEDLHSPRPDVLSDDELRGMTLIRVLGIGADEHGDEVFGKTHDELAQDRVEEWSDAEFYDLVDRFGHELVSPATASQGEDTVLCAGGANGIDLGKA